MLGPKEQLSIIPCPTVRTLEWAYEASKRLSGAGAWMHRILGQTEGYPISSAT
jgi:hypothetical protein